jgi:hypothetical protein
MAEVTLNRARILAIIGQLVAAGMTQHVRVRLERFEPRLLGGPLNHLRESGRGDRRPAFEQEDEAGIRLLAPEFAERPQGVTLDRMRGRRSVLLPANIQVAAIEIDLRPFQTDKLCGSQSVLIRHPDHGGVAQTVTVALGSSRELLDLARRQMLAGPQNGVRRPARGNCPIFGGCTTNRRAGFPMSFKTS